jgi:hypothetical protein
LGFWIAYILTRPLGASLGDFLSQPQANGGLGLGATITSAVFLAAILAVVIFLATTQRDSISEPTQEPERANGTPGAVWQVVVAIALLLTVSGTGYVLRNAQLRQEAAASVSPEAPLGDLSAYKKLAADLLRAGDPSSAQSYAAALENTWDNAAARLRPMSPAKWKAMDNAIDDVLTTVRAAHPNAAAIRTSVEAFIHVMERLPDKLPQVTRASP